MRKGFTLAEVLITLTIIGIVAALTIPNIIQKYKYQTYASMLAEDYSILLNAIKMAEAEYGPLSTWQAPTTETYKDFFDTHFRPYIKLLDNPCTNNNSGNCRFETKDLNGGTRLNGVGTTGTEAWMFIKVYLANGGMLGMRYRSSSPAFDVFIDVNGEQKPNRQGMDTYMLVLPFKNTSDAYKDYIGNLFFIGGTPKAKDKNLKIQCSKNYNYPGFSCGALLHRNGFKVPKNENWPAGYEYPY